MYLFQGGGPGENPHGHRILVQVRDAFWYPRSSPRFLPAWNRNLLLKLLLDGNYRTMARVKGQSPPLEWYHLAKPEGPTLQRPEHLLPTSD